MVTGAPARVRDDIVRLVHRGLPVPEFSRAVGSALLRAVAAEGTCLMTLDPATHRIYLAAAKLGRNTRQPASAPSRLATSTAACVSGRSGGPGASPTSCGPYSQAARVRGAR